MRVTVTTPLIAGLRNVVPVPVNRELRDCRVGQLRVFRDKPLDRDHGMMCVQEWITTEMSATIFELLAEIT